MHNYLYHGTSFVCLEKILKDGYIAPRGQREGNWDHTVPSNPDAVYLTTVYALHYALCALNDGDVNDRLALIELDRNLLLDSRLAPDEDFIEQATRKGSYAGDTTAARVLHYRDRVRTEFQTIWPSSLEHLGTCCYFGQIPVAAISRIAIIPRAHPLALASDPIVCLPNHTIMGAFYRNLTKRVFGDSDYEQEVLGRTLKVEEIARTGICVAVGASGEFVKADD